MAEFAKMIVEEYGIKKRGISPRNPQANSILERIHQVIGNMIKTFQIYDREDLEEQDPWSGILAPIMFGVRATYHTTLEATPAQLVFGRDVICQSNTMLIGQTYRARNRSSLTLITKERTEQESLMTTV